MANNKVVKVGRTTSLDIQDYWIRLADLDSAGKPNIMLTACNTGSSCYVVETGAVFVWHIDQWFAV